MTFLIKGFSSEPEVGCVTGSESAAGLLGRLRAMTLRNMSSGCLRVGEPVAAVDVVFVRAALGGEGTRGTRVVGKRVG